MFVSIKNVQEFKSAIHDYIIDKHELVLRDYEISEIVLLKEIKKKYENVALNYNEKGAISKTPCRKQQIHVHNSLTTFCSEPEKFCALYLYRTLFCDNKSSIISTLKRWLPDVVLEHVYVRCVSNIVVSDLYPSFAHHFFLNKTPFDILKYHYCNSDKNDNYIVNINEKRLIVFEQNGQIGRAHV